MPTTTGDTAIGEGAPQLRLDRILAPVDFSEATPFGLAPALRLVDAFDSELFLLHAVRFPYETVALERYYLDIEDAARLRLADIETDCRRSGRRTQTVVVRDGPPHDAIVSFATRECMNLIVMPTHSRHGVDRLLDGSVTERVVQCSQCPVLVVPPSGGREAADAPRGLGRIVLATDFSEAADAALPVAIGLAARLGAALTLAHVVTLVDRVRLDVAWSFNPIPRGLEEEVLAEARLELTARSEIAASRGADVDMSLLRGSHPALEIGKLATSLGAGLIVVASHGHSRMVAALIGSTASKLIRYAEVPLLITRPED